MSERRGCVALRFDRSSHRYQSIRGDQAVLRKRIRDLAAARVRYGYFRIYILLRGEGWRINHKRVYRLYCEEGLSRRLRRPYTGPPGLRPGQLTNAGRWTWSPTHSSTAAASAR